MHAYEFLNKVPHSKTSSTGLSMILDKGLGLNNASDLVQSAGEYIDFIKFGWGTAATFESDLVIKKNKIYHDNKILTYPGGTLLEIAIQEKKLDLFFKETSHLGFNAIEVSDGSTSLSKKIRDNVIFLAREKGFFVISEVGKKNPLLDHKISIETRVSQIHSDIASGSNFVIIEAREAGKNIGIYDESGNIISQELDILAEIGTDKLIFEAPLKKQQVDLILKFGPQVNLGNIASTDAISLETLRTGLRGDTVGKVK
ncbi:phosphosulfolactate synthase [Liquorilactobacillus mali]|uniref:phosphosulfolactate synthase n=1 Tax=Liquorilactobacillus mali TaxID=1618 RepID=UPI0023500CDC|nr:phosphosulfolactate synthase [Liquorilactobacillus mali]MDC7953273.1 phosphosulfolactate synthase [Liquorilactobacillus mali]